MARLQPSSDIDHGSGGNAVNKYGTGGGASPFATWYENLLVSNQDTSFVGNNLIGGNADFALALGMPAIATGKLWNVFLNGTIDVFNTNNFATTTPYTRVQVRIVDSAGNAFDSAAIDVSSAAAPTNPNSLREQWVDMPAFQVNGAGTPADTGQTPNSVIIHVLEDAENPDAYWGMTYFAIEIATFTVTVTSDAHSAWDQEGAIAVNPGANLTVTLTPDPTYKVLDVLVDSVSVGDAAGDSTYPLTLTNVQAAHTVSGTAAQPSSSLVTGGITIHNRGGSGGTVISPTDTGVIGQVVRYTITPGVGQRTSLFKVNGVDQSGLPDPLNGNILYSVAMAAGSVIQFDLTLADGNTIEVTFDRMMPAGMGNTYFYGDVSAGGGISINSLAQPAREGRWDYSDEYPLGPLLPPKPPPVSGPLN